MKSALCIDGKFDGPLEECFKCYILRCYEGLERRGDIYICHCFVRSAEGRTQLLQTLNTPGSSY
jgi:hypothetical protein